MASRGFSDVPPDAVAQAAKGVAAQHLVGARAGQRDLQMIDDAARAAFGGSPVEIADVRGSLSAAQLALLDEAGALLASSTASIAAAVKAAAA